MRCDDLVRCVDIAPLGRSAPWTGRPRELDSRTSKPRRKRHTFTQGSECTRSCAQKLFFSRGKSGFSRAMGSGGGNHHSGPVGGESH